MCKVKRLLLIVFFVSSGCVNNSIVAPSPLRAMRTAAELGQLGNFTDQGILLYSVETLDSYEQGALTNEILALTSGGVMGGLGTGAVLSRGATEGLLLGANGILMLLNLWRPVDRSGADRQGSGMIRESLGNYLQALMIEGYCGVPNSRVTSSGAKLFAETNAAIKVVNDLRQGILQLGSASVKVLQQAQEAQPMLSRQMVIPGCK